MAYYKNLRRRDRIAYANNKLPRNLIITYQTEIAKRLTSVFNPNTFSREGVAGRNKVPTQLIIEKPRDLYPSNGQKI